MDEVQNYPDQQDAPQESDLSHSDKAVGIITEPDNTYTETAKYPPKTIDWLLPFSLLLLFIAISTVLMMSNTNISYEIKQKQMQAIEKRFDDMVKAGQMTRQEADQQLDRIQEGMDMAGPITLIITVVSIFAGGFIIFFIVTGIYYFFSKFVLKGNGTYSSALVANGLTSYIGIIHVLAATILAFVFGRLIKDLSVASLMNTDTASFGGFLLGKIDIISIWAYIVLGIGLARMFKSQSTGKYIILSLGVWFIGSLLIFALTKFVPFLSFLGG